MVRVALLNIKKWRSEPTVWLVFAILLMFVIYHFGPFLSFAVDYDQSLSAWAVSGYFSHAAMPILYVALIGLMFCNAPFYDASSQFSIVRVGRVKWIMGQVLYIYLASFLMVVFIWLATWLLWLPKLTFENDWGRVVKSAVLTHMLSVEHPLRVFFPNNIEAFPPIRTAIFSFIVSWGTTAFGGTMFMFLNLCFGKVVSFTVYGVLWFLGMISDMTLLLLGMTYVLSLGV